MKTVVIVGAGPCGLFVATNLLKNNNIKVKLYDQKSSAGNKFLVAGKSGLNLTHSQDPKKFTENYFEYKKQFDEWFLSFNNSDLIKWANELDVETFIGSSGRVFPKVFKAAQLLKVWMDSLKSNDNFEFHGNSKFSDFNNEYVTINDVDVAYDKLVLALGGKSWSKTGSDGHWAKILQEKGIKTSPFYSMNSGLNIKWSREIESSKENFPVKYVELNYNGESIRGDIMLTNWGVEGSPVYYLSHYIMTSNFSHELLIDLKPDITLEDLIKKLIGKKSNSTKLKSILSKEAIILLKELTTKDEFLNTENLAKKIKRLKLPIISARPIEEAISTGGGVCMEEITKGLKLNKFPKVYLGGEMLAWDAPTGGYLLQACFTQGYVIAENISKEFGS